MQKRASNRLDMANSDASSGTVKVTSSSARTSAIHKEKFNVRLSGDEHNNLKHLKGFTGLAEIVKSKCLGEKPRSGLPCHALSSY